ncbi:thioredoxin domain-containing protein [Leifsonia sp. TF02-11]|uniref:DsbA family protein n=1 Tax=Leifsonia sp. TF02-11 TaxID=2815212 RepID=UPI001AA19BD8|nr:thioredoxin domain-containing protein [Leifsonia sp. TF02-11]MBO1737127.1 thioredoxin domain-containing protein [Leifsonia sp. TF02-11]
MKQRHRPLLPLIASLAVIVVVGAVFAAVALWPKGTATAGPRNMASGSIILTGIDGEVRVTPSAALRPGEDPTIASWEVGDERTHIQTFIDWTCPACKDFESQYSDGVIRQVAAGKATLEIFPVAILDHQFTTDYSTRAANAAACFADRAPDRFLSAQAAMFAHQAEEGGPGLSTDEILGVLHSEGIQEDSVDSCIRESTFSGWVAEQTGRVASDPRALTTLNGKKGFSTPTVVVDGTAWDRTGSLREFLGLGG